MKQLRYKETSIFFYRCVDRNEILKENLNLDVSKACQDSNIISRIVQENADFFTDFLHFRVNNSTYQSKFPSIFKLQISLLSLKRVEGILREIIDQSAYLITYQTSLEHVFLVKFLMLWIPIQQKNNVGSEKVTAQILPVDARSCQKLPIKQKTRDVCQFDVQFLGANFISTSSNTRIYSLQILTKPSGPAWQIVAVKVLAFSPFPVSGQHKNSKIH